MSFVTKSTEDIVKSESDVRNYRGITLKNGLKVGTEPNKRGFTEIQKKYPGLL